MHSIISFSCSSVGFVEWLGYRLQMERIIDFHPSIVNIECLVTCPPQYTTPTWMWWIQKPSETMTFLLRYSLCHSIQFRSSGKIVLLNGTSIAHITRISVSMVVEKQWITTLHRTFSFICSKWIQAYRYEQKLKHKTRSPIRFDFGSLTCKQRHFNYALNDR